MSNPRAAILSDEFVAKRAFIDALDATCADESRDLDDTERADYDAAVTRMEAIEGDLAKINKRQERFDAVATVTRSATPSAARTTPRSEPLPSLGEQLLARAKHSIGKGDGEYETIQRALAHGVSTDGIAPVTVEGSLINFVDANRYAVNASRRLAMPDNHAPTFKRPRVSQHGTAAVQTTEGDILSSQAFQVVGDTVTKKTYGGTLALSEQEIDWTDPALLELAVQDLAIQYAIKTDTVFTAAVVAAAATLDATETVLAAALPTSANFTAAITAAAGVAYASSKQLPDTLFVDTNWWGRIIGIVDLQGRPVFPTYSPAQTVGSAPGGATSFGGLNVFGLNVVVDPTFASDTMIVAVSSLCESYEQNKGLLTIAAPTTLETQIAYRGYFAANVYAQGLALIEAV